MPVRTALPPNANFGLSDGSYCSRVLYTSMRLDTYLLTRIRQRALPFMHTCKAWFTLAGELINAVPTRGAITARIAGTLVVVVLTHCTCINVARQTLFIHIKYQSIDHLTGSCWNDPAELSSISLRTKTVFNLTGQLCATAIFVRGMGGGITTRVIVWL